MHATKAILCFLALFTATLLPAQTNTWLGQPPTVPGRVSSWSNPAYWSAGVVPNGAGDAAQILPKSLFSGLNEYVGSETILIANIDIRLASLGYVAPTGFASANLVFPAVQIGSLTAGAGSLSLAGTGLRYDSTVLRPPEFRLENGRLELAGPATFASAYSLDVRATDGANEVWLRDSSRLERINLTLGASSRLDVADQARVLFSALTLQSAHAVFTGTSALLNSNLGLQGPGLVLFTDDAQASSNFVYFNRPAGSVDTILRFGGRSTAQAGTVYSYNSAGIVEFTEQANSEQLNLMGVRQLDVTGASTGTGTTGRQRAVTNAPAATSVVADDARTVSLGQVGVTDLLLGSNSVRLNGGQLNYIGDIGGAYVANDGSNLAGGGIIQDGPVSLVLNRANNSPYAVPVTVARGLVYSYREQVGPVIIQTAGQFQALAGTIASVENSGHWFHGSPGVQIAGDFTQTPSGTLSVFDYNQKWPALEVRGTAHLAGRLEIFGSGGYFVGTRRSLLLRAAAVSGRFSQAPGTQLSPMLATGVEYSDREVYFVQRQLPFVNAGATPSQQALGAHLDATLGSASGTYYQLLLRLNFNQDPALIAAGLGQLAPDRYGALNEQSFAAAAAHLGLMERRLAVLAASDAPRGFTVFADGYRQENRFAQAAGLVGTDFTVNGAAAAAAWRGGRWTVGVSATRDRTRGNLDGLGSTARIESTAPGAFARYQAGRFFIQGAASRSSDRYELRRNSGLISWPAFVSAQPRGTRTDLALSTGFAFGRNGWTITPFAGLLASHVKLDDFVETTAGGMGSNELFFRNWSVGSFRSRAGFDAAWTLKQGRVTPRLSVIWLHEFARDRGFSTGLTAAGGAAYRAPGRPAETDLVQASLGVDWRLTSRLGLSLHAGVARGRNSDVVSDCAAGLRWHF
jgi:uncharacterized protein with beta-barrel porin domain